jgi:acetyl esterase/lipase
VLLIHGVAWQHGAKEDRLQWGFLLARAGYLVIAINYRLSSPGHMTWHGNLEDVR